MAGEVRWYVVTMRADVVPGSVEVVGPWADIKAAARWGLQWQRAHGDNPCWNAISLRDDDPMARGARAPAANATGGSRDAQRALDEAATEDAETTVAGAWAPTARLRRVEGYVDGYLEQLWVRGSDGARQWREVDEVAVERSSGQPVPRLGDVF